MEPTQKREGKDDAQTDWGGGNIKCADVSTSTGGYLKSIHSDNASLGIEDWAWDDDDYLIPTSVQPALLEEKGAAPIVARQNHQETCGSCSVRKPL